MQQGPPKLWYRATSLQDVTTQTTMIWIYIAVKTLYA